MADKEILEALQRMLAPLEAKIEKIERGMEQVDQKLETQAVQVDQKLERQKEELLNGVKVLMENTVQTQINLVGEDVQIIRERMPNADDLETMETRLSAVEVVVKKHSKDIQDLKKAQ